MIHTKDAPEYPGRFIESRVKKLGKDLGVRVLGSYNPINIGCNPGEFFDDMHARVSCLAKIVN